jgi:PAS domain S-box-containing protein
VPATEAPSAAPWAPCGLFQHLPDMVVVCLPVRDPAGRLVDLLVEAVNDAVSHGPDDAPFRARPGQLLSTIVGPDFLAAHLPVCETVATTGQTRTIERITVPAGPTYAASLVSAGQGRIAIMARDITDGVRAERALVASEERYRGLLDDMTEGVHILDRDWRWVYMNRAAVGYRDGLVGDVVGRHLFEVFPAMVGSDFAVRLARCMEERVTDRFETELTFPDGSTGWFVLSVRPVPEGLFVLSVNVTERHDAEAAMAARALELRRTESALEEAREVAGLCTWRRDLVTGEAEWSPGLYELMGFDPALPPPPMAEADRNLDPDTIARRNELLLAGARTGEPWEIEFPVHRPDGETRWAIWRGRTLGDEAGRPLAAHGTALDITVRKRAEIVLRDFAADLEARVEERTRELEAANAELRAFSYSVSHDLRAPVRAIAGFARLLELRNGDQLDEDGRHRLHNVVTAGEHLGRLIDDLLAYSRVGRAGVRAEPVPIEPLMDGIRTACAELLDGSGGRIDLEPPLAVPLADPALLDSVLLNLVANALKYRRPDVVPVVTVGARRDGDEVVIQVADNGIGIPAEFREAVFEPFRRLVSDEAYPGTGIGLAIVRRSVRAMGGEVTVASEPGSGSTFTVVLPAELRPDPN